MTEITQKHVDDYAAGKVELATLLGLSPEYVTDLRGRAQFFIEGGHDERALIMLEMLEELDRSDTLPTLLAIEVLQKLGRSDAAEEKIERLLARDPHDLDALVAKAELLIATGELAPAAATLEAVVERDPDGRTDAGKRARAVAARASAQLTSAR